MASPIAIAGMGLGVVGAGVSAFGSAQSGAAQQSMYQYQAGVAQINKQIAEQNASYAEASGEVQAQQEGMKTRAEIGQTRATQGASGVDVNRGSAVDVRASEAEIGAENQALTRSNAARVAYGYRVEGAQQEAQSTVDLMAGKQAKTAGDIGAYASLLGGASSVSSKWLQGKQVGLF